jgi:hypothetical protein
MKTPLTGGGGLTDEDLGCKLYDKSLPYMVGKFVRWLRSRKLRLSFKRIRGRKRK